LATLAAAEKVNFKWRALRAELAQCTARSQIWALTVAEVPITRNIASFPKTPHLSKVIDASRR
jgi:hypothetical protein